MAGAGNNIQKFSLVMLIILKNMITSSFNMSFVLIFVFPVIYVFSLVSHFKML